MEKFDKILKKVSNKELFILWLKERFTITFIFFNKESRRIKYDLFIRRKMKKFLKKNIYLKLDSGNKKKLENNDSKIWVCWLQGLDKAPILVKICYQSLLNALGPENVVLIDSKNLNDYITLPNFVVEKRAKGLIPDAHFSDIIRLELLTNYGGTWIDSTVFIRDKESLKKIINKEMFMYSNIMRDDQTILFSSWLIHSAKNNELLEETKDALYKYWFKKKRLNNYFLFHIVLTILYNEQTMRLPIISNVPPHILQLEGQRVLNSKEIEHIFEESGIQKLSNKIPMCEENIEYLEQLVSAK